MEIKVPIDGMDGAQLRNLVFMLHAQQYLLNRAAGHENIHVPDRLVEELKEEPGTDQDFLLCHLSELQQGRAGLPDCRRYGDILLCRNRQCREEPRPD
jgi:hypothetical protein